MSALQLPSDYERLRPFRRLVALLQEKRFQNQHRDPGQPGGGGGDEVLCQMAASFLWMRLWCELALLARSTNKPGWLPSEDRHTYERSVAPIFSDDLRPLELLEGCGLVQRLADGWICELFAADNKHFAGNFQTKEERGAHHSALVRNRKHIAAEAHEQIHLLPAEVFKKPDGTAMAETEAQRAMNVIKTLDNCLKLQVPRKKAEYTAGLMADAFAASQHSEEDLTEVYLWLRATRDNIFTPKTAEAVLQKFEEYLVLAKKQSQ
jgi:hypothetical protein